MTRYSFILFFALTTALTATAQPNNYRASRDSDPEAKAIVDALKAKYEGYSSISADFTVETALAERPVEKQSGTLSRSGDKFHFKMGTQEAFSDGKALYLVLNDNKEVQINNLPDEGDDTGGILTPQSMLSFYANGGFVLALVDERSEGGKVLQYIEMKPVDRNGDYSKMRMVVDKKAKEIVEIKAFAKDGSRFTFTLNKVRANQALPATLFAYNKDRYPGYHLEDLRY
ncbi:MAG: outer membrane lipoprotein carrier protein LolA [Saprospiraceae bacterium]